MNDLVIAGRSFQSRFLLGTGKFKNKEDMSGAISRSGTQIVTVAMRRIDVAMTDENILSHIPDSVQLMVNTSGARDAEEAVRIARIARSAGYGNWVKIEVIADSRYLLPDDRETIRATETLAGEGFVVLPYVNPDLYTARALVKAGAAAIMPLGSLIGSNQGLRSRMMLHILREEIESVLIVDAGIGRPSHAAEAMEMGMDAVLVNSAVATADDPVCMAGAFAKAVEAGRLAFLAGMGPQTETAAASSPLTGFLYE
jgi:thiazole synthase